jgi:DNA-binding transcriptional ArsR family regulator
VSRPRERRATATDAPDPLDTHVHTLQSVDMDAVTSAPRALSPTLWRTCRVLANRVRLRTLGVLFNEQELPVSEVARRTGTPVMLASQYLRALNARGLLAARREGRHVYYRAAADASVRDSAPLLTALRHTFDTQAEPVETVFRQATAFTHPRRVQVVRALRRRAMERGPLARQTGISRQALQRHLAKLVQRRVVTADGSRYRLAGPREMLSATLLRLACLEQDAPG